MGYRVKEIFNTLQGEGVRAGHRSVFVRFVGCNMWNGEEDGRADGKGECARWCDTDFRKQGSFNYSSPSALAQAMSEHWAAPGAIDAKRTRWCVLTGGEPLLQVDVELARWLREKDWRIAIETNGTLPPLKDIAFDHVCVSPKLSDFLSFHPDWNGRMVGELKVVLPGHTDSKQGWTDEKLLDAAKFFRPHVKFVQPMDPLLTLRPEHTILHELHRARDNCLEQKALGCMREYDNNLQRCIDFVMAHPDWHLCTQQHKSWGMR